MGRVELNMPAIEEMFADPAGPVGRIIEHKTDNVEMVMRELLLIPGSGRTYTTRFYRGRAGRPLGNTGLMQVPGKLYAFPPRATPHTASAPGMSPARDTGGLLASVHSEVVVEEVVTGRVYASREPTLWLEYGTRYKHGSQAIYGTWPSRQGFSCRDKSTTKALLCTRVQETQRC